MDPLALPLGGGTATPTCPSTGQYWCGHVKSCEPNRGCIINAKSATHPLHISSNGIAEDANHHLQPETETEQKSTFGESHKLVLCPWLVHIFPTHSIPRVATGLRSRAFRMRYWRSSCP